MFVNSLAGFPPDQIRNFLYDAKLVNPANNAAIDPMGMYNAAVNFKVSGPEIDAALGWPRGTADAWIALQGLPPLVSGDYVVTTGKYLGDVRDELVNLGILTEQNAVVAEKLPMFFQYMLTNNIDNLQMELTLGWDIDSIGGNSFPMTYQQTVRTDTGGSTPVNYNENPVNVPMPILIDYTGYPPAPAPAPRNVSTPVTPVRNTPPGGGLPVATPQPVTNPITVPAPIDQTQTPIGINPQPQSKLPLILGIGAVIAATLLG